LGPFSTSPSEQRLFFMSVMRTFSLDKRPFHSSAASQKFRSVFAI
jgi:hypothetical protein